MVLAEMTRVVLQTKYTDFRDEHIENVKDRMIDIVGCALGGAFASGNAAVVDLIGEWGGKEESTILVYGHRVPSAHAAMVNAILCRSYDYEVCGPQPLGKAQHRMPGHVCATTECAALAVAESRHLGGKELISAAVLGGDLAVRIAITGAFSVEEGFDLTGTASAFGATAVAGRLLGLSSEQLLNAFGILVNEIAGSFQSIWDGAQSFKLPQGSGARNAIYSVELARRGVTGIKDALFGERAYFRQYCKGYHPEYLTEDLGTVFYTKGLHKAHPSCYGNHAAIEATLTVLHQHHVDVNEIAEIILHVSPEIERGFLNQRFEPGDSAEKSLFNLPYAVANALLRGRVKIEHYTMKFTQDPRVLELARKVRLMSVATGTGLGETSITFAMNNGTRYSAPLQMPRGLTRAPLSRIELRKKFWDNYDYTRPISKDSAQLALGLLENLEKVEDVGQIVRLLMAPPTSTQRRHFKTDLAIDPEEGPGRRTCCNSSTRIP